MQYLRFVVKGQLLGVVETRNMFEYATMGTAFTADDPAAIIAHLAFMFQGIESMLSNNWTAYAIEYFTRGEGSWEPLSEEPFIRQGANSDGFATYQTAVVINGTVAGFKSHARKFIAGLADTIPINGRVPALALVAFAGFAAQWLAVVTGSNVNRWEPGVLGKGDVWHRLLGANAMAILGTIRRRKPGYGI